MRHLFFKLLLLAIEVAPALGQRYAFLKVPNSPQHITALLQGAHSEVWVGTEDDVFLFDGTRFYSLCPYGFPRESVASLAEDDRGGIWIATAEPDSRDNKPRGGLYRYQNGRVEQVLQRATGSVVSAGQGTVLAAVADDAIYHLGDLYLFRASAAAWQGTMVAHDAAQYVSVDHGGTVVYKCENNDWCELAPPQLAGWPARPLAPIRHSMGDSAFDMGELHRDRFNCLWNHGAVSTWYACSGSGGFKEIKPLAGPYTGAAHLTMSELPDGSMLMVGNQNAVTRGPELAAGRPEGLRLLNSRNGVPQNSKVGLALRDGTVLLGADAGLYRWMQPLRLEYWTREDGVDAPYSILHLGDRVLAANNGIQTLTADHKRWIPWADKSKIDGITVHMIPGPHGTLYAASILAGVTLHAPDGTILSKTARKGAARLAVDGEGHVWSAGTGVTLIARHGSRLEGVSKGMDDPRDHFLDLEYDAQRDALWACHNREVVVRQKGEWTHITGCDGLRDDICMGSTIAPNGDAWVVYQALGDFSRIRRDATGRYRAETISYVRDNSKLGYGCLRFDARGWLWSASESGDNAVALPEAAAQGNWLRLGKDDGLPELGGNQNSFYQDPDGSVWFAGAGTITHLNPPADWATKFPAPQVFVAGMTLGAGAPVPAHPLLALKPGQPFVAHIGTSQFDRRSALRLRYRLLPYQNDWKETASFDLPLGRLWPSQYTLEVQGRMLTGDWSQVESSSFKVLWPLWLT